MPTVYVDIITQVTDVTHTARKRVNDSSILLYISIGNTIDNNSTKTKRIITPLLYIDTDIDICFETIWLLTNIIITDTTMHTIYDTVTGNPIL